ncbi:MAG: EpsI family protein [Desulfobulbaceae bacterium]|nr:EpsI family protein [Desulfobulbaceae bacterium]
MSTNTRLIIVLVLFGLTFISLQFVQSAQIVPIKRTLTEFPAEIGEWKRTNVIQSSDAVVEMLGLDDYINYTYTAPDGMSLNFYVSYFSSVGTTGAYHSPQNCLPGGGWEIESVKGLPIKLNNPRASATINSLIVQSGAAKQITLYWFQNRGRIIANEYWEKIYLVTDSILKRRRDGSFVRIMAPATEENMAETEKRLKEFAEKTAVLLEDFIPGKDI